MYKTRNTGNGNAGNMGNGRNVILQAVSPNIPENVAKYSGEFIQIFLGMFSDILLNVWRYSPEYNTSPSSRVPNISFPVPVFLVLYIAKKKLYCKLYLSQSYHSYYRRHTIEKGFYYKLNK